MTDIKPSISTTEILTLLQDHFSLPVTQLAPVEGGQVAQTFSFEVEGQAYILRFNNSSLAEVFAKEQYIFRHFAAPRVPVPGIQKIGQFQGFSFAISRKLPGRPVNGLPPAEFKGLLPALMETLAAIHEVDVSQQSGFGHFDAQGLGKFQSWAAALAQVREEEAEDSFFGRWHHLFDDSFLEREFFERLYARMVELRQYCPEERYLVHGDYGFTNLLADGGKISGVLDWANAQYGDFLYDVAWLDFWSPGADFRGRFQQYYLAQQRDIPYYSQRLLCYGAYIGLNGLRFFAKLGNQEYYRWVQNRVLEIEGLFPKS